MGEYSFKEVKELPPRKSVPRESKYQVVIDQCALRLEQTPSTKWLEVHRNPPMNWNQAINTATAVRGYFGRHYGQKFVQAKVRPNGAPGAYALYVRRGENYK
jgi:hypothetical protein